MRPCTLSPNGRTTSPVSRMRYERPVKLHVPTTEGTLSAAVAEQTIATYAMMVTIERRILLMKVSPCDRCRSRSVAQDKTRFLLPRNYLCLKEQTTWDSTTFRPV